MNYIEWNNVIAKHFFNNNMARKEVLLYVNEAIIDSLGKPFGDDINIFLEAVKCGPPWVTRTGFCQKAHQSYSNWRSRSLQYPPYIAYLACFVLAATQEGDWAPHAYYPRFRKLLDESEPQGILPSIDLMDQLWEDLEKWCNEDKKEELGRFVKRIRGNWCNVGLPLSQTIISNEERKNLNIIFEEAKLDPTDAPPPEVIPRILQKFGQNVLEKRTFKLLSGTEEIDKVLKTALLSVILEELEQWDGSIHLQSNVQEAAKPSITKVWLRLCLKIDDNNFVTSSFRFKTNVLFPEEGLCFELSGDKHVWSCEEDHEGWSKKLKDVSGEQQIIFDASKIDWKNGVVFCDQNNQWEARLKGETTKLFFSGSNDSLYDWIETHHLERGLEFRVCCYGEDIQKVKIWGESNCSKFTQKEVTGLPKGWVLFYGENAKCSCPDIDVLCLSSLLRLKLKGIKVDNPNIYLKIAPPEIVVENGSGDEKVIMNEIELNQRNRDRPVWRIPKDAPINQKIRIEVVDGDLQDSKTLELIDPDLASSFDLVPHRDNFGEIVKKEIESPKVSGVIIYSKKDTEVYPLTLPTHLSERIIFIGAKPGEIIDWPNELLSNNWSPIWALARTMKKVWVVHYCGNPKQIQDHFNPSLPCKDHSAKKKWKKAVWVNRKITKEPNLTRLRLMWAKYKEVAHHV